MLEATVQTLDPGSTKTTFRRGSEVLSFGEVIGLWQRSEEFRIEFTATLVRSPFQSYFWETPPVTTSSLTRPFEFVLISAPSFGGLRADRAAFADHFRAAPENPVVTFTNLSGDATLVVPAPRAEDDDAYTHLASFLRKAPAEQVSALWRSVGFAMEARVSSAPTWLSTAGMGVSWLHVRLDSRPKYYRHGPYKKG